MIKVNIFKRNGDILGVEWSEMVRFLEENISDVQGVVVNSMFRIIGKDALNNQ